MNFVWNLFRHCESPSSCQMNTPLPQRPAPTDRTNGCCKESDRKASVRPLDEEVGERDQWTGQLDFLMSLIAYAVGLGAIDIADINFDAYSPQNNVKLLRHRYAPRVH